MNQPFGAPQDLSRLVLVAGHAVFIGDQPSEISEDSKWLVAPYQRGETTDFVKHIQRGVELAAADRHSLLLFSGGATRPFSEPLIEAESYRRVAELSDWWGHPSVALRTDCELFARDSLENLLFGLCRFYELTGRYPQKTSVVSWAFKHARFACHKDAIGLTNEKFRFEGAGNPVDLESAEKGESKAIARFQADRGYRCARLRNRNSDSTEPVFDVERFFAHDDLRRVLSPPVVRTRSGDGEAAVPTLAPALPRAIQSKRMERDALRQVSELNRMRSVWDIGWRYTLLLIGLVVAIRGPIILAPLLVVLVGVLQGHLLLLAHEALHQLISRQPKLNDFIGRALLSYPCGQTFLSERRRHLRHHRYVGTKSDPDYERYALQGKEPWSRLALYFLKMATYGKIWEYLRSMRPDSVDRQSVERDKGELYFIAVVQIIILSSFMYWASPWHYLVFWLLPLVVITVPIVEFREFCEHVTSPATPILLKTFRPHPLERFILGPVDFVFHAEHHFYPSVPHYSLRRVTEHLTDEKRAEMEAHHSYLDVVRRVKADIPA